MSSLIERFSSEGEQVISNATRTALNNNIFVNQDILLAHQIPPAVAVSLQQLRVGTRAEASANLSHLQGFCYEASVILLDALKTDTEFMQAVRNNIAIVNSGALPLFLPGDVPSYYHHYLSALYRGSKELEIIIDPTIGQFLAGYNGVFVGTREKLEETVHSYHANNKLIHMKGATVNEHIKLVWGKAPIPSPIIRRPLSSRRG